MGLAKFFSFLFVMMFITASFAKQYYPINGILGDLSYTQKFGHAPDENSDELVRIKTHLEFVEKILRMKDVSSLPAVLQKNRMHMIDLLHDYWTAGIFPRNFDFPEMRIPCFIDRENRICAVGYLIEQTAGREIAEQINSEFQYSNLMDMNNATVDSWIASSGLTKKECAIIQPGYEHMGYENPLYEEPLVLLPPPPVDATRALRKFHEKFDSLLVLTHEQNITIDSLNSELTIYANSVDSLTKMNEEKETQIAEITTTFEKRKETWTLMIWILSASLFTVTLVSLFKWMQMRKSLNLAKR